MGGYRVVGNGLCAVPFNVPILGKIKRKKRKKVLTIAPQYDIIPKLSTNAAIAQSVERILGKDEVASSNLASSPKKKTKSKDLVFFLELLALDGDLILFLIASSNLGSDGSAAGGGRSDLSEWQRSARNETALSGEVSAGHRNRTAASRCRRQPPYIIINRILFRHFTRKDAVCYFVQYKIFAIRWDRNPSPTRGWLFIPSFFYDPFSGIILDALPYFIIISLIANHMVVISALPYIFSVFLIAKPLECAYKL